MIDRGTHGPAATDHDRIVLAGPAYAQVFAAIHRTALPAPDAWSARAIAEQLAQPTVFALLHETGGMLIGRVVADEAELLTLAVAACARRRGIGRTLLQGSFVHAAARGARAMFLEVSFANTAALQLYRSNGFAAVGRRARYYADGTDAQLLRKSLTPPAAAEDP